jgi:UDP-glucose 4-epimerase
MRYVITGGSGYLGSVLTKRLAERDETERIVNLDIRPPAVPQPKSEFVATDVRDRGAIRDLLGRERPDALVHLAFVLNPIHDEARMYDIDVNGTHAVLWAAADAGTEQVLVTSSATAYGAFPDNPKPIAEDWPVRGHPSFPYARDKADADRLCQLWAAEHPDRVMTIVRPSIVFGPSVDNFIVHAYERPFTLGIEGMNEEFQLVHEDDVPGAIGGLLDARAGGAFNLAGDGLMRWREAAELAGLGMRDVKFRTAQRVMGAAWKLHAVEAPPGFLDFVRYPWVVSNDKLKRETGWEPKHDTRSTFEQTMKARGRWQGTPASSAPEPAAV